MKRICARLGQRAGMTLIEVLVAITITAIVMGGLITAIWQISLRSQRLTAANQAMESVLTVNHILTRMIGSSSYVEITYDTSSGVTRLWLFRGGVPSASAVLPSQPWMYNSSTTVAPGMSGVANVSATPPAIYGANCYYLIEFVPNTTGSNNVYAMPATNPSSPPPLPSQPLAQNVNVTWYLPALAGGTTGSGSIAQSWLQSASNLFYNGSGAGSSGASSLFVNSLILKLSSTYTAPSGQTATYALTAGYHDAEVG
ncbi:prepilin-type N-terminal cleavage/methylation domain-containing protein [Alicyclobacillus mali (ex Roth et al. 2021)]|uniref:prepilin-type N-terminal cleavage/methylation domain-containing protein n=2 Tax=Alicyclobacillus mali (ex Roth et al. 2021) TaxID=1123961 RepID=UPI0009EA1368|nr:prepilin-type N-terminal cleavage/methylation domain-containing protein [Alicyclobacillus mali (ex Roth et al. 2021)]